MEGVGACVEPAVPCLFGWMTCCWDSRVVWRSGEATRLVALTIDDVPRAGTTVRDVYQLMDLLKRANAHATFFVIFKQFHEASPEVQRVFMQKINEGGHEVGLHFKGRWGHTMDVEEVSKGACEAMHLVQRGYNMRIRHARMPGGFSTPAQVTALERLGLKVVNGTGYPFDVDLCACLSALALGRCAARLVEGGGRIAILHDTDRLQASVEAFLDARREYEGVTNTVVTLDELLERIAVAEWQRPRRCQAFHAHWEPCPLPVLALADER